MRRSLSLIAVYLIVAVALIIVLKSTFDLLNHEDTAIELPAVFMLLGIAFVVAFIFRRICIQIGLVTVVGIILAGLVISFTVYLSGRHLPHDFMHLLSEVSEIGVWGILFLAGLELNYHRLKATGGAALKVAGLGMVGPIVLGVVFSTILMPGTSFIARVAFGVVFCATSVGVPLIVARQVRDSGKHINIKAMDTLSGAGVADDIGTILVLAVLSALMIGDSVNVGALTQGTLFSIIYILVSVFIDHPVSLLVRQMHITDEKQKLLFITAWIGINIGFAYTIGVSSVVAAFGAGLQLDEVMFERKNNGKHLQHAEDVFDLFITPFFWIFFLNAGLILDWSQVTFNTLALGILAFVLVGFAGKYLFSQFGAPREIRKVVGLGMSHFAEVAIVVSTTAFSAGVFTSEMFAIALVGVITSLLVMPILFSKAVAVEELMDQSEGENAAQSY